MYTCLLQKNEKRKSDTLKKVNFLLESVIEKQRFFLYCKENQKRMDLKYNFYGGEDNAKDYRDFNGL